MEATAQSVAYLQNNGKSISALVRGFDENADKIYKASEALYNGVMPNGTNQIIIGKQLKSLWICII